jgi:hypothetical protein
MLQSPLFPELHSSFYFDNSNSNNFRALGRSKAMAVGSSRNSPGRSSSGPYSTPAASASYLTPAASSSAEAHLAYEPTTPRTYSHSPASVSTSAGGDAVVQPWMFALFPDTYADAQAYSTTTTAAAAAAATVVESHYMHSVDGLVYGQAPQASRPPHGAHPADAFDARIHGGGEPFRPPSLSPSRRCLPPAWGPRSSDVMRYTSIAWSAETNRCPGSGVSPVRPGVLPALRRNGHPS